VIGDRRYPQVKNLRTAQAFADHVDAIGADLPFDVQTAADASGPLGQPLVVGGHTLTNRFAILPMEGWDGTTTGAPTDLVRRRWQRFGGSGAGLIWGGEAVAVRHDGRANPRQLVIDNTTVGGLAALRAALVDAAAATATADGMPFVGLQLTHSGRFSRPHGAPRPRTAQRDSVLDARVGVSDDSALLSDDELDELVATFIMAAGLAANAGFDFVDVKACHGYLVHELLSAYDRPGRYGGSLEGRMGFLRQVVGGIRDSHPQLRVGVRLTAFDIAPFAAGADGVGAAVLVPTRRSFGSDGTASGVDVAEPLAVARQLVDDGVAMICVSGGSPYYNPHAQRPAYFPPSDGYKPPEDPLIGVARMVHAAGELKRAVPEAIVVASGLSYVQEWLPAVAATIVARGLADVVGIGRMALSYPGLPRDVLKGQRLERRFLCRTFSDCTTAPRNGLVSGCYPLDPAYKQTPERLELARIKRAAGIDDEP
jgi:2,4-dienoyl-CoA reductase-like NADH-dependent reductase (Old Yellow Enzyme family)